MSCPICGLEVKDEALLTAHVNEHFDGPPAQAPIAEGAGSGAEEEGVACPECGDWVLLSLYNHHQQEHEDTTQKLEEEDRQFKKLQKQYGYDSKEGGYASQYKQQLERAAGRRISAGDYHRRASALKESLATGKADHTVCTEGVVDMLRQIYSSPRLPHGIVRGYVCSPTVHYASSFGDRGWGCGYRNIQMLVSCLLQNDDYAKRLFDGVGFVPEIPRLQRYIEAAWAKGFDAAGCEQLGNAVYYTKKWIGATEVTALFRSFGVRTALVDFHKPTGAKDTHPELFDYVLNYFKQKCRSPGTSIFQRARANPNARLVPPIYLQHMGHSRLIVGIEEATPSGDRPCRLLILDPGCPTNKMWDCVAQKRLDMLRRTPDRLRNKQYQLVVVEGIMTDDEIQASKVLSSKRIP